MRTVGAMEARLTDADGQDLPAAARTVTEAACESLLSCTVQPVLCWSRVCQCGASSGRSGASRTERRTPASPCCAAPVSSRVDFMSVTIVPHRSVLVTSGTAIRRRPGDEAHHVIGSLLLLPIVVSIVGGRIRCRLAWDAFSCCLSCSSARLRRPCRRTGLCFDGVTTSSAPLRYQS